MLIAQAEDSDVQNVLQQAYEEKLLRGQRLMAKKVDRSSVAAAVRAKHTVVK